MTKDKKEKLLKYLYPTNEIMNFMCNDLYQELLEIIPSNTCINSKNTANDMRIKNHNFVKEQIENFITHNVNYSTELKNLFRRQDINELIDDILVGFVFYISNTNEKYKDIDIFKDKKSICYTEVSIIDLL